MKYLKGVIHLHSKYSYDGEFNIEKIAKLCRKKGYNFSIITEHADSMNIEKMKRLVSDCKKLSDKNFILIPGIEFNSKSNLHILGLGIKKFFDNIDEEDIIDSIHKAGGIAVLAHPNRYKKISTNKIAKLDGVEIWSFLYDNFSPSIAGIKLVKELRKFNKNVFAYGGLDFHYMFHFRKIVTYVKANSLSEKDTINGLKNGRFYVKGYFFALVSNGEFGLIKKLFIHIGNFMLKAIKKVLRVTSLALLLS